MIPQQTCLSVMTQRKEQSTYIGKIIPKFDYKKKSKLIKKYPVMSVYT